MRCAEAIEPKASFMARAGAPERSCRDGASDLTRRRPISTLEQMFELRGRLSREFIASC